MPPPSLAVLVIEDEPDLGKFVQLALASMGVRAFVASTAAEGVGLLQRHAGEIDRALVDLHMPDQGGLETIQALLRLKPGLHCCLTSGSLADAPALEGSGVRTVLAKPFRIDDLMEALSCVG
jgi:DNA-binding response OmpR family regulator